MQTEPIVPVPVRWSGVTLRYLCGCFQRFPDATKCLIPLWTKTRHKVRRICAILLLAVYRNLFPRMIFCGAGQFLILWSFSPYSNNFCSPFIYFFLLKHIQDLLESLLAICEPAVYFSPNVTVFNNTKIKKHVLKLPSQTLKSFP